MKRLKDLLDPKYIKISVYAVCSVLLAAIVLMLLNASGGFWSRIWTMFTAVLRPLVIGLLFAYLLSPLVRSIESKIINTGLKKMAHPVAVVLGILFFLLVINIFLSVIVITLYKSFSAINIDGFKDFLAYAETHFTIFVKTVQDKLAEFGFSVSQIGRIFSTIAAAVRKVAGSVVFGAIFAVYLLLDTSNISKYWDRVFRLIAGNKADEELHLLKADADTVFSGYIRGQFCDAALIGVMTCVILQLFKVPNAIVIGTLTGFGNLIPYVGPVVGYLTLAIVCISSAAWDKLIIGAVSLALIMFIDGNVINPKLLSSNVKVHPLLVIAALIAGGAIGGFVGMIVAVPTAAFLKIQLDRYLDKREKELQEEQKEATETKPVPVKAAKKAKKA